jgi:prolyl oligopeptidase
MTTLSLEYVRALCKRADGHLPALFEILPRCPYGVEPVPAVQAPDAAAAFYIGPSDGCGRGGVYYINTYQLQMRPKYSMPSTSLHETVPGHHLQVGGGLEASLLI